ncbi:hypothetical protein [Aeromonas hydrophila]|uniref:hypothetical protein n=1 Tax=Aeromonas hydrophila TaxID=644 RepID=UPI0023609A71|nr:hypothetical protein [Aeromonas hydrophila]
MRNNTHTFITIVNQTMEANEQYFFCLEKVKIENHSEFKQKIMNDLNINQDGVNFDFSEILKNHIKDFILNEKESLSMSLDVLKSISNQLEIDYLLKKLSKEVAYRYYSISHALIYYGIYRDKDIQSFDNTKFWIDLVKMIHLLNMSSSKLHCMFLDGNFSNHPDFNQTKKLVEAKNNIEDKLGEKINIVDGKVYFNNGQEERIVTKIESKLSRLHLFNFIRFIFNFYELNKSKHNIEHTIPYKYVINILVKNISKSKHKNNDSKKIIASTELLNSFISLYQLKENKFESMNLSEHSLVRHLKKQVLYSNFYPLYPLKTDTLIEYIKHIIKPSVNEAEFLSFFGFNMHDLIDFFDLLDKQTDDIIIFDKKNVYQSDIKILELFSIDAERINQNYSSLSNLKNSTNLFSMNPIIKYKNQFYVIGFKYFKMNFYNTLVEKIRKGLNKEINRDVGTNVDLLVENIFNRIKNKHDYEVYSGNYKPPKKENPESDLILNSRDDVILIENKNKYLTGLSFSGSDSNILKDFVLSFALSQKQLFKHQKNLIKYKKITFIKERRELKYENQNIVKISVSTNNWLNIMNNNTSQVIVSLIKLRFNIKENEIYENKDDFLKANKCLDELEIVINELYKTGNVNMSIALNQTLFLPLELIVDKYKDDDFIKCLKYLVGMKMNTDNIMNVYDYAMFIISNKSRKQ